MAVCLQKRGEIIHIIGWTTGKGGHYTLCDRFYPKQLTLQTFGLGDTVSGMCQTCKHNYDLMYADDLEYFTRMAHGSLHEDLVDNFKDIENGHAKIQDIYTYLDTQFGDFDSSYKRRKFRLSYYK